MPIKDKEKRKAYYQTKDQKDKKAIRDKEYYQANKEKILAYKQDNKVKIAARMKAYQDVNKEKLSANNKIWRKANKEELAAKEKAYKQANPEVKKIANHNYRARKKQNGGQLSKGITEKLMALQRGKCAVCKKSVKNGHHLDHIMPLSIGGSNTDDNIQILCPSCNCSKGAKHPQDFMKSRGFLL